jgi:hypothetical protein
MSYVVGTKVTIPHPPGYHSVYRAGMMPTHISGTITKILYEVTLDKAIPPPGGYGPDIKSVTCPEADIQLVATGGHRITHRRKRLSTKSKRGKSL